MINWIKVYVLHRCAKCRGRLYDYGYHRLECDDCDAKYY